MVIPVVYEDQVFLVINKPVGIIVNRAETVRTETVQDWADSYLRISEMPQQEDQREYFSRSGIVHRIDKETSGLLLLSKTPEAFFHLQAQFKDRVVKKSYVAIAHGLVVPDTGEIRAPIGRLPWNRERFGVVPGGKESLTVFRTVRTIKAADGEVYTLLELFPETGRTHQIRVHLKYINHPILGDYLYAGRKTSRDDRTWASRVMLHAWKLTCTHPDTGEPISFEAPIPDDMNEILSASTSV